MQVKLVISSLLLLSSLAWAQDPKTALQRLDALPSTRVPVQKIPLPPTGKADAMKAMDAYDTATRTARTALRGKEYSRATVAWVEAAEQLNTIIKLLPDNANARHLRAEAEVHAVKALESANGLTPQQKIAHWATAVQFVDDAVALEPAKASHHYLRARLYVDMADATAPNKNDFLGNKPASPEHKSYLVNAAEAAKKAAELEPSNTEYQTLYKHRKSLAGP